MFVAMKIVEVVVAPLNLLAVLVLASAVVTWWRRPRLGRALLTAAAVLMVGIAVPPWPQWLLRPLEDRFPAPAALPEQVDGIVVLGGAIDPLLSAERGQPVLNGSAERMTAMAHLARRFPLARVVFTGGSGSVTRQDLKEAPVARALLQSLGIDGPRILYEEQSRNTWENAVYSRTMVEPRPGETWLLVTSAAHMPRAVGAFRAAGWTVAPYPVDYVTGLSRGGWGFEVSGNVGALGGGLREWAGLAYYRLRGWSDSWYPKP